MDFMAQNGVPIHIVHGSCYNPYVANSFHCFGMLNKRHVQIQQTENQHVGPTLGYIILGKL